MTDWLSPATWPDATPFEREQIAFAGRKARITDGWYDFAGRSVIDVGCWTGYRSLDFAERGSAAVVGLDIVPERIERARDAVAGTGLPVAFDQRGLYEIGRWLPGGEHFDLVWCAGVLHHLPFLARAIYCLAHASRDVLILECRTDRLPYAQVRRVEPHAGDYAPGWATIPTVPWIEAHILAAGFKVENVAEHYEGDRTLIMATRLQACWLERDEDLSEQWAGALFHVAIDHDQLADVADAEDGADRWPHGGVRDRTAQRIVEDFDPALFVPLIWSPGERMLIDGRHRLTAARRMGLQSVRVIVAECPATLRPEGVEV